MSRHKSTDHNKVFAFVVPAEIVEWPFESIDLVYFFVLVIENVQSVFSVIRLSSGVVIGLKLHQELVGCGTELEFDLFCLFDGFLIERVFRILVEKINGSRVGLFVEEQSRNHEVVVLANFAYLEKFNRS